MTNPPANMRTVQCLNPRISIGKSALPVLFIDTFMWRRLATDCGDERQLLRECCDMRCLVVVLSNALEGELTQRNLLGQVRALCGDCLLSLPLGRISANQVIHALVCYLERRRDMQLNWDLMISQPVGLDSTASGLRQRIDDLVSEMNRVRTAKRVSADTLVSGLAEVERSVWSGHLRAYANMLLPWYLDPEAKEEPEQKYLRFFYTDYFSDLPFVVLKSYFLADIIAQREIKTQDVIDVHCIAELLPYSTLFILDKDQHNRLQRLCQRYPLLFSRVDEFCCTSSTLKAAGREPRSMLRSFLEYARFDHVSEAQ